MLSLRSLPLLRCAALAGLISPATQAPFAQQQQPQAQPQLVESISVTGTRRLKAAELLSQIKTRLGDPYDHEQAIRDFQTLMNLGFFDRLASRVVFETGERGGVEISFELRELPLIESVEFEGLRPADEAALLAGLRRRGLAVEGGNVYDGDRITKAVNAMEELLRGLGWRGAEVSAREDRTSLDSVKLTFVITGQPPMNRPPRRLDRPVRRDSVAVLFGGGGAAGHVLKLD